MATRSGILAWETPWTEELPVGYSPRGPRGLDVTDQLTTHVFSSICKVQGPSCKLTSCEVFTEERLQLPLHRRMPHPSS